MGRTNIRKIKEPKLTQAPQKKKKLCKVKVSDIVKEELISSVRLHACIWDKSDPGYKNNQLKYAAWKSISDPLDINNAQAKDEWKKLVDQFRKKLIPGKSGDALSEEQLESVKWKFFRSMLFLKDSFKKRETVSNYTQEQRDELEAEEISLSEVDDDSGDEVKIQSETSLENEITSRSAPDDTPLDRPSTSAASLGSTPVSRGPAKANETPVTWQKQVASHMDKVVQLLAQPSDATATEKFLNYLGEILASVSDDQRRPCQKKILEIANAYADGDGDITNVVNATLIQ